MNWKDTDQQIRNIPGNGPVLKKLFQLLESGDAIALVGSGVSVGLWPMWNEFVQGLILYTEQCKKIDSSTARFFQKEIRLNPLGTIQQLRHKLDDTLSFGYLDKTFSDKISPDTNKAFTPVQQALLQLPIQNYVTLNYDAGLANARSDLYPDATAAYCFWDQPEVKEIEKTHGFDRFILHAHGRYDRHDSLVFSLDDCRKAYSHTHFVRTLNRLFDRNKLLMAGFDWKDPFIKQLFDNISGDYKDSLNRHVALVSLDDEEMESISLYRAVIRG